MRTAARGGSPVCSGLRAGPTGKRSPAAALPWEVACPQPTAPGGGAEAAGKCSAPGGEPGALGVAAPPGLALCHRRSHAGRRRCPCPPRGFLPARCGRSGRCQQEQGLLWEPPFPRWLRSGRGLVTDQVNPVAGERLVPRLCGSRVAEVQWGSQAPVLSPPCTELLRAVSTPHQVL